MKHWPDTVAPLAGAWNEALQLRSLQLVARERRKAVDIFTRERWQGWGRFSVPVELLPDLQAALRAAAVGELELVSWLRHFGTVQLDAFGAVPSPWGYRDNIPMEAKTGGAFFGFENRLPFSEDLTGQSWAPGGGATITLTPGQADPDGGNMAWRVQSTGGNQPWKFYNVDTNCPASPLDIRYVVRVWVKTLSGTTIIKTHTSVVAQTVIPSQNWVFVELDAVRTVAGPPGIVFNVPNASDQLDCLVYRPSFVLSPDALGEANQLNFPNIQQWGYLPTGANRLERYSRRFYVWSTEPQEAAFFGPVFASPVWLAAERESNAIAVSSDAVTYDVSATLIEV